MSVRSVCARLFGVRRRHVAVRDAVAGRELRRRDDVHTRAEAIRTGKCWGCHTCVVLLVCGCVYTCGVPMVAALLLAVFGSRTLWTSAAIASLGIACVNRIGSKKCAWCTRDACFWSYSALWGRSSRVLACQTPPLTWMCRRPLLQRSKVGLNWSF